MKKFIKYIPGFALAAALSLGLSSCQDDVDAPADIAPVAGIEANTTILELKERFWSDANNYAETIADPDDETHRFIIKGRVISSDKEGNIFKSIVIQDETAALAFSVDSYNLYLSYRRGQEVVIDVTGMTIGKYAALQQIGHKSWYANGKTWQVSFMAYEMFKDKVVLNGMPDLAEVDTIVANTFSDIPSDNDGLRKYQSQLVRFKNVYFQDGGEKNFSVYHTSLNADQNRTLVDREGNTRIVRTSGYATWCEKPLPAGNIDLVGIMSYYNDAWQIMMLDYEGVIQVGDVPGTKENPYDVPGAIKDIKSGIAASGWVKGYIVGAVAPEVETVSSNADVEWEAPTVLNSTLVIAPDPECKEISECLVVQLPAESVFRQVGNLKDNPGNLGKAIMVKGDLKEFMGTPGVTGNTGKADSFEIEGVSVDSGEVADGDGTQASPYNVAQVIKKGDAVNEPGMWVSGYIVGFIPTGGTSTTLPYTVFGVDGAVASNMVLAPTPDCEDPGKCIPVQLATGTAPRAALNLVDNPGNLGALVAVKGDLIKYCGAPGVKTLTEYAILSTGGDVPVTPPATGATPSGDGSQANPYNVAKALEVTSAMDAGDTSAEVYVTGVISKIKEVSTSYGNASYYIVDEGYTTEFYVFQGWWLNGEKFTDTSQIAVGAKVVVKGSLVNYMGNTPEMAKGNQLVSYNGETTPDTPVTPPSGGDDTEPGVPGDPIAVDPIKIPHGTEEATGNVDGSYTVGGFTITLDKSSGTTAPAINVYNGVGTLRAYADNTVTISGSAMAKIVFEINTGTGSARYTTFTPNVGSVDTQASGDTSITWTGNNDSVTFTVGHDATLGSDGASKRGQVHISKIEIYPAI